MLLDFCKAFDKVPHGRLLCKLKNCGIQGNLIKWIEQWLTKRNQRVILEGHTSREVPVKSGVPQGTVLGPLMFLLYINDIDTDILSTIRLFADDCIIYRAIDSEHDSQYLQKDLDTILHWAEIWQMKLNIDKCVIIRCTRSPSPIEADYKLKDDVIKTTSKHRYLGIILNQSMHWSDHITTMCKKANKSFNFIRRNLSKCHQDVKISAYLTIIRPLLEYAACIWDPHQEYLVYEIEKIQRRAARWALSDYNRYSSVSEMLRSIGWPTLESRRHISRLTQLYKIIHHHTPAIHLPPYYLPTQYPTRHFHQHHYILPSISTTAYQQSFFPKTIKQWNNLPKDVIESSSVEQFVAAIISEQVL